MEIAQHRSYKSLPAVQDALHSYLTQVHKIPLLSPEKTHALAVQVKQNGNADAARQLVLCNLRLVIKIALEFHHRFSTTLMDLIQEGNLGLIQAVQKFDPYRGVKFSYYASYWIRAYILRFLMDNLRLVKIGTTRMQRKLLYHLQKEKDRMEQMGLCTCPACLPAALGADARTVVEMEQRLAESELSLDAPSGEESRETFGDHIAADKKLIDEELSREELRHQLKEKLDVFKKLISARERDILEARILSEVPVTLQALGAVYGITKERIRQIERNVKVKIKHYMQITLPELGPDV
jgi:RNA polymerase sigma-32 factor